MGPSRLSGEILMETEFRILFTLIRVPILGLYETVPMAQSPRSNGENPGISRCLVVPLAPAPPPYRMPSFIGHPIKPGIFETALPSHLEAPPPFQYIEAVIH